MENNKNLEILAITLIVLYVLLFIGTIISNGIEEKKEISGKDCYMQGQVKVCSFLKPVYLMPKGYVKCYFGYKGVECAKL